MTKPRRPQYHSKISMGTMGHKLAILIVLHVCFWVNVPGAVAQNHVSRLSLAADGFLRLYSYHLNEFLEVRYLDAAGNWDQAGLESIDRICRSRDQNQKYKVDSRLIVLADHLQDHFGADVVEIISCYRSPEFNKKLKAEGHAVANESFHTKGMAMDIHLDEIREDVVRDYLLKLRLGGVGYYGNRLMVHMDFGPVRTWTDGEFKDNTKIGIFNDLSSIQIRTTHLHYRQGDEIHFKMAGALPSQCQAKVERFSRGQWQTQPQTQLKLKLHGFVASVPHGTFGKFRLHCEIGSDWQNSNEFYVRKTP